MGTWGLALSSSDTYSDIYAEYYNQFNSEISHDTILKNLENKFEDVLLDNDEKNDFVFAIVKASWEIGEISEKYFKELENIIRDKSEYFRWINLGGTQKEAEKRQNNTISLYDKVKIKNVNPKKKKKTKLIDGYFSKGDCITFKDKDGFYTAAIILSKDFKTEFGLNLVLVLDYLSKEKPKIEDFLSANCAMTHGTVNGFRPWTQYCYAKEIKKIKTEYKLVGNILISKNYPYQTVGHSFGSWNIIPDWIRERKDKAIIFSKPVKVKKMINKGLLG